MKKINISKRARGYDTKKECIIKTNRRITPKIIKRGYLFGIRGGHIPLGQATIKAEKKGNKWYPFAIRMKGGNQ